MKTFFQWTALYPPTDSSKVEANLANIVGLSGGVLGLLMVLLGLDSGLALYVPILASSVLFGLPHGAIDHLVILGLAKHRLSLKALSVVCLAYLGFVIAMLALWWAVPFLAVILFLGITVYHWGRADLAFENLGADVVEQSIPKWLQLNHALLRGVFPIGIPFLSFPQATETVLNACSASFGYTYAVSEELRLSILVGLLLLLLGEVAYLFFNKKARLKRFLEDVGLIAFFVWVPPLLAVGLYFCLWHGFRHVIRLIRYQSPSARDVSVGVGFKRFYLQALPFTVASICILAALQWALPEVTELNAFIGLYLVVISSLTVPHLIVVEWMDRVEKVF